MKKILSFSVILFIGLLAFISSCTKDKFTEQSAYNAQKNLASLQDSLTKSQILLRDSLKNAGGVINYSVAAVLASDANWISNLGSKGTQSLDKVIITIGQYGVRKVDTTDASGIASFKDLRIGTVNVNIKKTGYTEVDFVAVLPALSDTTHVAAYGIVRHVGTMVPLFSLTDNMSTLSGIATVETDLTNDAPEIAAGIDIMATIDVDSYIFQNQYLQNKTIDVSTYAEKFDYYGIIKQIAFHSVISKATTADDGSFSIKVPSTPDGLPIKVYTSDFAVNQKLLQSTLNNIPVWGVQTIRTLYGPTVTFSYSSIPTLGTAAGNVQSAYVTISAPTGTPAAQPTTEATATAVLTSSGIKSINITNPGEGYTQPPLVKISKGTAFNSVQAEGTAVISGGKVTSVTIDNAGTGYKPGDTPTLTFVENIIQAATATAKIGFSISGISVNAGSLGYTSAPAVTITSNSGTGAAATANMSGYVSALTLTNPGAGYTAIPIVTISASTGTQATASAVMTTSNPVNSVTVPVNSGLWVTRKRGTRITGVGSGALTDSTSLSNQGRISSIAITNVGAGYITAPTVTISGGGGFGAVAHATIAGGQVSVISIDNQGQGYTSDPAISLTPAPTGGTNATASLIREFQVTGINVTSSGNGYVAASTAVQYETAPGSGIWLNGSVFSIVPVLSMSVSSLTFTAGDSYSAAPTVTITPSNGIVTTQATATASLLFSVKSLTVTTMGSGYEGTDVVVSIAAPPAGGTQATVGTISRTNGVLSRVILNTPGAGYTAAPNVYLTISGAPGVIPVKQAEITATVSGGQVTALTIADPGAGYDWASDAAGNYTATISTYKSASTATANPNPKSGQIDFIQISNPGAGYVVVPTVEIVNTVNLADANQFGTGATATAVVTDGRVSAITVTNAGSGYYITPTVKITVASTLMNAVAMCTVDADGKISGVTFPAYYPYTKGYGYNAVPTVTFNPSVPGKGTGATGVAILKNGQIDNIVMTNMGSGYIGKNNPGSTINTTVIPNNGVPLVLFAGKTYIRDIYFGTGKRTTEQ